VSLPPGFELETERLSAEDLHDRLVQRGFSPEAAAGITANVQHESDYNPAAIGDNGSSFGLFQWHGKRGAALKGYARLTGRDWADPDVQLDFLDQELGSQFPQLKDRLQKVDAAEAARIWTHEFERPANVVVQAKERGSTASRILECHQPHRHRRSG
jgi:hypothetical protein